MKLLALSINGNPITGGGVPQGGQLNATIGVLLSLLILAAVILALFYIVWGGFTWLTSGGDKQKLQGARQKIVIAIIGLILVFLAFFIVNIITNFFRITG